MKIGIFGDSYAQKKADDNIFDESWMAHIERKGYEVETFGWGGTPAWYSYKKFLENYNRFTHIVFVYSSVHRNNNMPDDLAEFSNHYARPDILDSSTSFHLLTPDRKKQLLTIIEAQQYAKDDQLDKFIVQNVFDHVNRIARLNNKKIVNVLPFQKGDAEQNLDLARRTGDCINNLVSVSVREMPDLFRTAKIDPRRCHLTLENNQVLGDIIIESLDSTGHNIINAGDSGRFIFSKDISQRYYNMIKE